MTPAPTLQDLIATVHADAPSDDPLELLATAASLAAELDQVKDEVLGYFVDRCRGGGRSWTEISAALGVSKQAVHSRFAVATPALDRFTDRARRVVEEASEVARGLQHGYVGTEHLLVALFHQPEALGTRILTERGLTRQSVEAAALVVAPRGTSSPSGDPTFTPRAVAVLTGAVSAAIELGHNYVGTEHLLLALMRDPDAVSAKILFANGVEVAHVRRRTIELLAEVVRQRQA